MFRWRSRKVETPIERSIWNGWTERMITSVNGMDRFDFQLRTLQITSSFDGQRYAHGVWIANHELQNYQAMPLLFSDMPDGIPKESYDESEANITGVDVRLGIGCDLSIVRSPLSEIAAKEQSGDLHLTSEDLVGDSNADEGRQFKTPVIAATLYDSDGALTEAVRRSFMAALPRGGLPELRLFLNTKIEASLDTSQGQWNHQYRVKSVISWETWGRPLNVARL